MFHNVLMSCCQAYRAHDRKARHAAEFPNYRLVEWVAAERWDNVGATLKLSRENHNYVVNPSPLNPSVHVHNRYQQCLDPIQSP